MTKGIFTCVDESGVKHQLYPETSSDMVKYSNTTVENILNSLSANTEAASDTYVAKVTGKGLSTNDFTDAYKTALDGLENNYAKKSEIVAVSRYKGTVADFVSLNSETAVVGDTWNISVGGGVDANGSTIKAGDNVIWNGTGWDNHGGDVDLSNCVKKDGDKVLSDNNFSDAYKNKLDSVETETYVAKVAGKDLSTNDFTNALKTKLEGIETNAQVNVIEGFSINGVDAVVNSETKVASVSISDLQFCIGNSEPTINNVLWLDTTGYED